MSTVGAAIIIVMWLGLALVAFTRHARWTALGGAMTLGAITTFCLVAVFWPHLLTIQ